MIDLLRDIVLRFLAVPAEPQAPPGDASTLRVFRAAPAYYHYKLLAWGIGQLSALAALIGATVAIVFAIRTTGDPTFGTIMSVVAGAAWALYLLQLPLSLGVMRLDYEMRWYIVSDRAMRIREGVLKVREQTMTFANVQQVGVRQGPLQRLFGISDVFVRSAGGGAGKGAAAGQPGASAGHEVYYRGVDNAVEIRDAIRARARLHRGAGLGDPDDAHAPAADLRSAVGAARGLLDEVRALRGAV